MKNVLEFGLLVRTCHGVGELNKILFAFLKVAACEYKYVKLLRVPSSIIGPAVTSSLPLYVLSIRNYPAFEKICFSRRRLAFPSPGPREVLFRREFVF